MPDTLAILQINLVGSNFIAFISSMRNLLLIPLVLLTFSGELLSQPYSHQDSIRGTITPEREWWDLSYYHLDIKVDPSDSTIIGQNTIGFNVLDPHDVLQVELQPPLQITGISMRDQELSYDQDGYSYYIHLPNILATGSYHEVVVQYAGRPHVAFRAPWDGGISWKMDRQGSPFVASSCQGIGASIWWPCKDHMYDEVDSMKMTITVPQGLTDISNGQLIDHRENSDGTNTSTWMVRNPINNYGVNINIGKYAHWTETYQGESGDLRVDYYPLAHNLERAQKHWAEVPKMLDAFEYWFGPIHFIATVINS